MQQNTCTTVCWSTHCNIWQPPKDLGSCYCDTHPTMELLSSTTPAMVPHTAAHGDTCMNAVSKQSTLSQVAWLPHHRLQPDTASQWHSLHHPHLHHACSPHPLHLQHWQSKLTRPQLFPPCQLFTRMPQHQCPCHTCAAMKIWPCLHGTKMPYPGILGTIDPDCPWTLLL